MLHLCMQNVQMFIDIFYTLLVGTAQNEMS